MSMRKAATKSFNRWLRNSRHWARMGAPFNAHYYKSKDSIKRSTKPRSVTSRQVCTLRYLNYQGTLDLTSQQASVLIKELGGPFGRRNIVRERLNALRFLSRRERCLRELDYEDGVVR